MDRITWPKANEWASDVWSLQVVFINVLQGSDTNVVSPQNSKGEILYHITGPGI